MRTLLVSSLISIGTITLSFDDKMAYAQETALTSKNTYSLCTTTASHWVDFCNGLRQGYADYAVLYGNACIPAGTTRTTLITIYTDRLPQTNAYSKNEPAIMAAVEVLARVFPC